MTQRDEAAELLRSMARRDRKRLWIKAIDTIVITGAALTGTFYAAFRDDFDRGTYWLLFACFMLLLELSRWTERFKS